MAAKRTERRKSNGSRGRRKSDRGQGDSTIIKFIFVFLVLFMTITVNLSDGMLARVGIDPNYLYAALASVILAGLTASKPMAMSLLVITVTIGANLPTEYAERIGVNQDFLLATLIALIIAPQFKSWHS
ncbi:hypothetical protein [Candidatus Reidiella endopervernicosa]|uniref:Uncharacterized protein n=1 Tax=Candidatus Reidiella endopervernicosa TaxID=2738883 RepID=A0A6N0HZ64_9GAMM|nr:hypothetical protein [Candidatus Reidiella endopervernicosa]QKQ27654.1 hypothetical protein HUE57_16155 [Candidatus Reidiella endopervernicosa]